MTKTIASRYFQGVHAARPLYGGVFDIPAVPKGAPPALLTVADHVQMEKMPHLMGGRSVPVRILGEEIAACLVREWASEAMGMNTACGPAIWVVRDTVPLLNPDGTPLLDVEKHAQFRPATDEERAQMWAEDEAEQAPRQDAWGEYLIGQGDMLHADPLQRKHILISPTMRAAAKYFGRAVPWLDRKVRADDTKMCAYCGTVNASSLLLCQHCKEVADPARYALQKDIDKQVAKAALAKQSPEKPVAA